MTPDELHHAQRNWKDTDLPKAHRDMVECGQLVGGENGIGTTFFEVVSRAYDDRSDIYTCGRLHDIA